MLSEQSLIIVFVTLTVIIPIFIGIMISRVWGIDEIDKYMNEIINQTKQNLNNTTPKDFYTNNFTDNRGNTFEGNRFGEQLGNNTPVPWPICMLPFNIPTQNGYWCHSV